MPNALTMFNIGFGNQIKAKPASWLDFWSGLSSRERLITLGILTAGAVAVINSTVWAIAVGRMARSKSSHAHFVAPPDQRPNPAEHVSVAP